MKHLNITEYIEYFEFFKRKSITIHLLIVIT